MEPVGSLPQLSALYIGYVQQSADITATFTRLYLGLRKPFGTHITLSFRPLRKIFVLSSNKFGKEEF